MRIHTYNLHIHILSTNAGWSIRESYPDSHGAQTLFERLPVTLAADAACGVRVGRLRQWTAIERARTHERTAAQRTDGGTLGPTQMRLPWSPFQSTRQCFFRMASARASTAALAKSKTRGAAPTVGAIFRRRCVRGRRCAVYISLALATSVGGTELTGRA